MGKARPEAEGIGKKKEKDGGERRWELNNRSGGPLVAPKGQLAVDALNLCLCAVEGIELDLLDEWISTRSWWMVGTCVAHARVFFVPFWCHGAAISLPCTFGFNFIFLLGLKCGFVGKLIFQGVDAWRDSSSLKYPFPL
jgi:hypothetical protein